MLWKQFIYTFHIYIHGYFCHTHPYVLHLYVRDIYIGNNIQFTYHAISILNFHIYTVFYVTHTYTYYLQGYIYNNYALVEVNHNIRQYKLNITLTYSLVLTLTSMTCMPYRIDGKAVLCHKCYAA